MLKKTMYYLKVNLAFQEIADQLIRCLFCHLYNTNKKLLAFCFVDFCIAFDFVSHVKMTQTQEFRYI